MKIYLAGPDVFRPDVDAWAESARALCRHYGFEPLLPVDNDEIKPEGIFRSNITLIRKAQIVIANLNPFRGLEPDSGTAFELGYAFALDKQIYGYVTFLDTLAKRVEIAEGQCVPSANGRLADREGMLIENFNLPCNLMLAVPAYIVEGGLEECLRAVREGQGMVIHS